MKYKTSKNTKCKSQTIHDLPKDERPRERLYKFGADKLSDSELLAIILRTGLRGESVLVLAQRLISHFGSLLDLLNASVDELMEVKGIGTAKAIEIASCFEIARRINKVNTELEEKQLQKENITDAESASSLMRNYLTDFTQENFLIASFDTRNRLIGVDHISKGTLTASLVHPREVFKSAIRRKAACIIVAHNHPSGDADPSDEDIKITKRLTEAGKIMGIELLDHLIITRNRYYSFKEKNLI